MWRCASLEEVRPETGVDCKLFGRRKETAQLQRIVSRISDDELAQKATIDFALISGNAGCGKTSLARSVGSSIVQEGGFFISGKFEQVVDVGLQTSAFSSALSQFALQASDLDDKILASYREKIQEAIGSETRLLTNMVPALGSLVGIDSSTTTDIVEQGHAGQVIKRFEFVLRMFLRVVSSPDKPLVILLDDLQWAEKGALDVLSAIVSDATNQGICFLATHRNDESCDLTLLNDMLANLDTEKVRVHRIVLENLGMEETQPMLAEALSLDENEICSLSKTIYASTKGNPLFLLELARTLREEASLQFVPETHEWTSVSPSIHLESTIAVFRQKILQLPKEAQEMMKIAACLGSQVDIYLLGLLVPEGSEDWLTQSVDKGLLVTGKGTERFDFVHDHAQKAAYGLINDEKDFHLSIGRKLWRKMPEQDSDKYICTIVEQLLCGCQNVDDEEERVALAALCLHAGKQAAKSAGFHASSKYFQHGLSLLGPRRWVQSYDLTLALMNAYAELKYCIGRLDEVEQLVDEIVSQASSLDDALQARSTLVYALGSSGRLSEAISCGLAVLRDLGESIPANPSRTGVVVSLTRLRRLLRTQTDFKLLALARMTDRRKITAMNVLNFMILPAVYARPLLMRMILIRMIKLTILHGVTAASAVGFSWFGYYLLGTHFSTHSNIEEGYRFGNLALSLYKSFNEDKAWLSRVYVPFYGLVNACKNPVHESLDQLRYAYRSGLGTGDNEYAMLGGCLSVWNTVDSRPLPVLEAESSLLAERLEFMGQRSILLILSPIRQFISTLRGLERGNPKLLKGSILDAESVLCKSVCEKEENQVSFCLWTQFYSMALAYLFWDLQLAEKHARGISRLYKEHNFGVLDSCLVIYYECLILLSVGRRIRYVRRLHKRLTIWAKHSPLNFLGKQYMIEAELAVATKDHLSVIGKYTSAVSLFRTSGFQMQEALANERLGRYLISQDKEDAALPYLHEAARLYEAWGGVAKLQHFQNEVGIKSQAE